MKSFSFQVVLVCLILGQVSTAPAQFGGYASVVPAQPMLKKTSLEGALLPTVAEQELFKLRRAKEFAAERDFRSAIALWQSVLDSSGSQLLTRDEWRFKAGQREYAKYATVASEIESILAGLPDDGLRACQFRIDGEARALLANPRDRSRAEVLNEVVRRFFLSAEGDEAAFELACLKLDRYEFTTASRLLRKCLEEHPDCTVPRDEIVLRLAVANARIGDAKAARAALQKLTSSANGTRFESVKADVRQHRAGSVSRTRSDWLLRHGGSDRAGTMLAVPDAALRGDLTEAWSVEFDVDDSQVNVPQNVMMYGGFGGLGGGSASIEMVLLMQGVANSSRNGTLRSKIDRGLMINQWKQNQWTPTGEMLLHKGMIYTKRGDRVMCCSADDGRIQWMGVENEFQLDPAIQHRAMFGLPAESGSPQTLAEVQLFGDRVFQAMSIGDGNFYSIEGRTAADPRVRAQRPRSPYGIPMPPRTRKSRLSAYELEGGKLRWRRSATEGDAENTKFAAGFSSAPVSGRGAAFVTVSDSGAISLVALDPNDGSTIWKTFLCDEPVGACSPWTTTAIAYHGGDVYVGTGAGVVAAVDSVSGSVRWVVRYERSGSASAVQNPYGMPMQSAEVRGWKEEVVVPTGRHLIVMASDSDQMFAIDQRTGEFAWDVPQGSGEQRADYYLGTHDTRMFVGGRNAVRCFDAGSGDTIWEVVIEDSFGTGIVTEDAVYVPAESTVVKLSLEDGSELSRTPLFTMTREPVGNLYSDGERLLAVGMARVYAMTQLDDRLHRINERVADGDADGCLERMRIRAFQGDVTSACQDLTTAYELIARSDPDEASEANTVKRACDAAISAITELNLPSSAPEFVLGLVGHMMNDLHAAEKAPEAMDVLVDRIQGVLFVTLNEVEFQHVKGLTDEILAIAPMITEDYLVRKARRAIEATSSASDVKIFRDGLGADDEATQIIAIYGLAKVSNRDSLLSTLRVVTEENDSERSRLVAALVLLNGDDRHALKVLGELLEAEDEQVQQRAERALVAVSRREAETSDPFSPASDQATKSWQDWIAENWESVELQTPYEELPRTVGRTLACYVQTGSVVEYDLTGKKTWSTTVNMPCGLHGLSNGHRLIASYSGRNVIEYDEKGREVWRQRVSGGHPYRVCRLENGHTLVATHSNGRAVEYRKDGTVAWQFAANANVMDARRMRNGNTLVVVQDGKVLEIDPAGQIVWSRANLKQPICAQPLLNGNVLIALVGQQSVVEMTREGKTVWSQNGLTSIMDAQRLPNGNTLIVDSNGAREFTSGNAVVDAHVPQRKLSSSRNRRSHRIFFSGGRAHAVQESSQLLNRAFRY